MKKRFTDYIRCMSEGDIGKIEDIISKHYRKFVKLYRILEKYSDNIITLKYRPDNDDTLDVYVEFDSKRKLETMKRNIDKYISEKGYNGKSTTCDKKGLLISLSTEEK